jgi:hypothetical protein
MRAELLALAALVMLAGPARADDAEQAPAEPAEPAPPVPEADLLEFLGEFTHGDEWVDPIALDEVRDRALDRAPRKTEPRARDGADQAERGDSK